ncbi:FxsA [Corynebacterium kutscheri]|uniref:FxsA n=1 Tax=Corynebacterium kutscheri TaxID=35755 RepID=A0A0F6TDF2_9CORY|nr:FxsA family protein [Corynebacterium kutscheri]AKE41196.1 protein affecting phage T7 exclusion by the F plasmid [Corynebacterium kutscheri]VEH08472.1 FxsA [Corynebacterium kutscheri]VEH09518.1 FxsA [Corynebacterium kutscheri]VEH79601.1 FxsA [Corynebacterium kutscheri]
MRLLAVFPYVLIETLAFWGVASWLGVGKALLLLLGFFFGGLFIAAWQMNGIARKAVEGKQGPGQTVGDLGLIAAGAMAVALPGFVSSILGLLLIIPPTRSIIRSVLARKLRALVEDFGMRSYQAANMNRPRANFGSFNEDFSSPHASAQVIDEQEIQQWSKNVSPDDFSKPA